MSIEEEESNVALFNDLIRKGLSTNDVQQFALKQAAQCRVKKQISPKLLKVAMKLKRMDALAHVKRLKQEKYRIKKSLLTNDTDKAKKRIDTINKRASTYRTWLRQQRKEKFEFIQNKRLIEETERRSIMSCHPEVRHLLKNLDVFKKQIDPEPPVGPLICHPDIKLTKNEMSVLNKGPKYMVRRQIGIDEFRLEVEKCIAKQNYNDGNDDAISIEGDEKKEDETSSIDSLVEKIEIESKMLYNFRESTISLGKLRGTDFKYNKRIFLPNPKNTEREALHEMRRTEMAKVFKKVAEKSLKERDRKKNVILERKKPRHHAKDHKMMDSTEEGMNGGDKIEIDIRERLKYLDEIKKRKIDSIGIDDKATEVGAVANVDTEITKSSDEESLGDNHEKVTRADASPLSTTKDFKSGNPIYRDSRNCHSHDKKKDENISSKDKKTPSKEEENSTKLNPAVLPKEKCKYYCSNLTSREEDGLKTLTNRVKEGEIVVASSDKSNRFVVLQKSQYLRSGIKHTLCDTAVDQTEVKRFQTILNDHARWFTETFKIGEDWGHGDRMLKNVNEKGEQTCPMSCLIKDHKGWEFSVETPVPPSRPVIAGNVGINRCLSEILSLIIEPITDRAGGDSIDSTGDMLHKINELNKSGEIFRACTDNVDELTENSPTGIGGAENENKQGVNVSAGLGENKESLKMRVETLRKSMLPESNIPDIKKRLIAVGLLDRIEGENPITIPGEPDTIGEYGATVSTMNRQDPGFVIVGSDVEKLYPSLQTLEAARIARMAIMESVIDINGVDLLKALRYIYIVGGNELIDRAGLSKLKPRWLGKRADLIALGGTKTNQDKYWSDTKKTIHRKEARKIIATMVEIGIVTTMSTHLYTFNGIIYVQLSGGPIGLRLTAALANLVMAFFDRALREVLMREHIKILISFRYVDDGRLGMKPISPGWRWTDGRLQFHKDKVNDDQKVSPQKRTTLLINDILNSIVSYLKFTTEDCEDFDNHKLPTLDCELWVENHKIMYNFYEKPQVSNRLLLKSTALAGSSLKASLTQEGVRRLLNTSLDVGDQVRVDILNKFAMKLINSGFTQDEAQSFMVMAATSFVHKVSLSKLPHNHVDYKPLHLSREYMRGERMFAKAKAKSGWFKVSTKKSPSEGTKTNNVQATSWRSLVPQEWKDRVTRQREIKGTKVSTIMMVPNTAEGELLNLLVLKEAKLCKITGYRAKLVEGNGVPLSRMIPSPTTKDMCDRRELCQVCVGSQGTTRCQVRNVVYVSECLDCWVENSQNQDPTSGTRQIYIGETSRSLRERSDEHILGANRMDDDNFVSKHWQAIHPEMESPPKFIFKVHRVHRDPLSREIHEALLIQKIKLEETILNSKSEWNRTSLQRLCIEKDEWEIKKEIAIKNESDARDKALSKVFRDSKRKITFESAIQKLKENIASEKPSLMYETQNETQNTSQQTGPSPIPKLTNERPTFQTVSLTNMDHGQELFQNNLSQSNNKFLMFSRQSKRRGTAHLDAEKVPASSKRRRVDGKRNKNSISVKPSYQHSGAETGEILLEKHLFDSLRPGKVHCQDLGSPEGRNFKLERSDARREIKLAENRDKKGICVKPSYHHSGAKTGKILLEKHPSDSPRPGKFHYQGLGSPEDRNFKLERSDARREIKLAEKRDKKGIYVKPSYHHSGAKTGKILLEKDPSDSPRPGKFHCQGLRSPEERNFKLARLDAKRGIKLAQALANPPFPKRKKSSLLESNPYSGSALEQKKTSSKQDKGGKQVPKNLKKPLKANTNQPGSPSSCISKLTRSDARQEIKLTSLGFSINSISVAREKGEKKPNLISTTDLKLAGGGKATALIEKGSSSRMYVWRPDINMLLNSTDDGSNSQIQVNGFLWKFREVLSNDSTWLEELEQLSGAQRTVSCTNETPPISPVSPTALEDMCDWENYEKALPEGDQLFLMKGMWGLTITEKNEESEEEKGLDGEVDQTVWEFVKLLSHKLDQNSIPNLFGTLESPTGNMIVEMLHNHKLRSTYDFEKAVSREWKLSDKLSQMNSDTGVSWNFRMIDMAAGPGTAVQTIFELKERGIFRGAKRRLRFDKKEGSSQSIKCPRMESENTKATTARPESTTLVYRSQLKLNISHSIGGWHGGRKSPPKASPPKNKSPKKKGDSHYKPSQGRGSARKRPVNLPDRSQSSIREFVISSPRAVRVDSAARGARQ